MVLSVQITPFFKKVKIWMFLPLPFIIFVGMSHGTLHGHSKLSTTEPWAASEFIHLLSPVCCQPWGRGEGQEYPWLQVECFGHRLLPEPLEKQHPQGDALPGFAGQTQVMPCSEGHHKPPRWGMGPSILVPLPALPPNAIIV
uniref:Uncharacterized protein n=1 Tax=Pipistrellus kuhlii TaxID=59472 RepID=A0A7J7Y9G7_PIPKU|nr:hypothetical protein mPipKuh1_010347 [Pipistrellus kuhlii]